MIKREEIRIKIFFENSTNNLKAIGICETIVCRIHVHHARYKRATETLNTYVECEILDNYQKVIAIFAEFRKNL